MLHQTPNIAIINVAHAYRLNKLGGANTTSRGGFIDFEKLVLLSLPLSLLLLLLSVVDNAANDIDGDGDGDDDAPPAEFLNFDLVVGPHIFFLSLCRSGQIW